MEQQKFTYEKIKFDRFSTGRKTLKRKFIETVGFLVKDLPMDYIELVVHRSPQDKSKWVVSELSTGHKIGKVGSVETTKTKNHAVVLAIEMLNRIGKEKVEEFLVDKQEWVKYYRSKP